MASAAGRRRRRATSVPRLRAVLALPAGLAAERFWYAARRPLFRAGLLPLRRMRGAIAAGVGVGVPGEPATGEALLDGIFAFAGQRIVDPTPFWDPPGARRAWLEELHGFGWLSHLRALETDSGWQAARMAIEHWIAANRGWSALAWRPDIVGRRLANWLSPRNLGDAGVDAPTGLDAAVRRQAGYLAAVLPAGLTGAALIAAVKGLIYAELVLRGPKQRRRWAGLALLEREIEQQIMGDGGQVERSPSAHLAVLRDLIDIRDACALNDVEAPDLLRTAIQSMTPVLRLYQHGDGKLALFNDSTEEEAWAVQMTLVRAEASGMGLLQAPETGFQRLTAGRATLIADCGQPAPPGFDGRAHAGTLAFEFSVGAERLIVNCGAQHGSAEWDVVQRSTAAHSTLVVEDTNSSGLLLIDERPVGLVRRPDTVTCRREARQAGIGLDLAHDGYVTEFGVTHRRWLFLASEGDALHGEDQLVGDGEAEFAIRFHLHPQVRAALAQDGQAVLLRLASGEGWRLRVGGGELSVSDSVYLGEPNRIRRCQQVVISATTTSPGIAVRWALRREYRS